jgi:hypothetical protein
MGGLDIRVDMVAIKSDSEIVGFGVVTVVSVEERRGSYRKGCDGERVLVFLNMYFVRERV